MTSAFCRVADVNATSPFRLSHHSNSHFLHWLEYKLLSVTHKVLITPQPGYLRNLISVQSRCRTSSASVVTISQLPSSSSLTITNHSFQCASPWNPFSLSYNYSSFLSSHHNHLSLSLPSSPLLPSITPNLFFFTSLNLKLNFS